MPLLQVGDAVASDWQSYLTLIVVLIAGVALAAERLRSRRGNNPNGNSNGVERMNAAMHNRFDRAMDKAENNAKEVIAVIKESTREIKEAIKDSHQGRGS